MKATELRIGNYVNVPRLDQSPFRIDAFEYLSSRSGKVAMNMPMIGDFQVHPLTWYLGDLTPIELTEEILLKCGFEKKFKVVFKNKRFYIENWGDDKFDVRYRYNGEESLKIAEIKYIHQLQNLYFALTNEELEVTI